VRASKRHSLRGFGNETERGGFIKNLFTKFVTKLLSHLVPCSCFEDGESLLIYVERRDISKASKEENIWLKLFFSLKIKIDFAAARRCAINRTCMIPVLKSTKTQKYSH
jgi:hypothetical protein